MGRRLCFALLVSGAVAQTSVAAAQPKGLAKLPAIETFALGNGLKVAVLPIADAPAVSVQVWYRAGSKDEPRDRRGTARLFEHLMFEGSDRLRTGAHAQYVAAFGGAVTAQADEDSTHFINVVPAAYAEYAVQLEAERMRHLMFRPETLAAERKTVADQIRQQDAQPIQRAFSKLLAAAYTKHPYAWSAAGVLKDLDAIALADVKKFYDTFYQPNNALLVVVGKTTTAAVKAAAEKHFGPIAKGADPVRPAASAAEPPQTEKRRETAEAGALGVTLVGFHIPAARDKDIFALQVAAIILGAGDSSRIKQRLRATDPKTKRQLAGDGGMETFIREDPGMVVAYGLYHADPDGAVEAALVDEIAKLAARGPSTEELRKAKNLIQSGFTFSLESASGLATAIGRSWVLVGDPGAFVRDLDEIERIGTADVTRVVKKYMAPEVATIVVMPKGGK
jgi:zinc protease